jgi:esterase/lipase superfamily enzyme
MKRTCTLLGLLCALAGVSHAAQWDLCARGIGSAPPFTQTLRVQLTLSGAELDADLVKPFAAQLIRATLWPGRAEQVYVELYDEKECTAALGDRAELKADVSEADVADARAALGRGEADLAVVSVVARRTQTRLETLPRVDETQKQWLRIYYATNRQPLGQTQGGARPADAFGTELVETLSFGAVEVAVLNQTQMRDIQSTAVLRLEKATSLDDIELGATLTPLSLEDWRNELRKRAERFERPGVLLFIHGYKNSFVDAAKRAGQLAYDLAFPGPTVFFSWPSDAALFNYKDDLHDARLSRRAAARVLAEATGLLPGGPVYVVAHSMGNRVFSEGMMQLAEDEPGRRRALREVVMAAPDLDQEEFRQNIAARIGVGASGGPRFTLYANARDMALKLSEALQGGQRLGHGGAALYTQRGLDSVDATAVAKEFFGLNHSYFGDKTTVLADLFHLIRQRTPAAQRPNLKLLPMPGVSAWAF